MSKKNKTTKILPPVAKSELELNFKQVAKEINKQLAIAESAVKEATALAKKAGVNGFVYNQYDIDSLEEEELSKLQKLGDLVHSGSLEIALQIAGWRTSNMGC